MSKIRSVWVLIVHPSDKKVLILKRSATTNNPNLWNFPGGKTDEGEKPRQSAVRELFEETGIRCKPHELVKVPKLFHPVSDTKYYVLFVKTYPRVRYNEESQGFRWEKCEKLYFMKHEFHYKSYIPIAFDLMDKLDKLHAMTHEKSGQPVTAGTDKRGKDKIDKYPQIKGTDLVTQTGVPLTHTSDVIYHEALARLNRHKGKNND